MISPFIRHDTHRQRPVMFLKQIFVLEEDEFDQVLGWEARDDHIPLFFNLSEIRRVLANATASSSYASQRASNTALHHQISCSLLATSLTSVINS